MNNRYGDKPEVKNADKRLRTLEQRLNDGYELIEKRRSAGYDVSKLEDFWTQLLHEYREMCDGGRT